MRLALVQANACAPEADTLMQIGLEANKFILCTTKSFIRSRVKQGKGTRSGVWKGREANPSSSECPNAELTTGAESQRSLPRCPKEAKSERVIS